MCGCIMRVFRTHKRGKGEAVCSGTRNNLDTKYENPADGIHPTLPNRRRSCSQPFEKPGERAFRVLFEACGTRGQMRARLNYINMDSNFKYPRLN